MSRFTKINTEMKYTRVVSQAYFTGKAAEWRAKGKSPAEYIKEKGKEGLAEEFRSDPAFKTSIIPLLTRTNAPEFVKTRDMDIIKDFINADNIRLSLSDIGNTLMDSIEEAAGIKINAEIKFILVGLALLGLAIGSATNPVIDEESELPHGKP